MTLANDKEIWKPIYGYTGAYEVSSFGRVRSLDRKVKSTKGHTVRVKGHMKSPTPNKDGYLMLHLRKNKKNKFYSVHRLVALNFLGASIKREVNHKDGDKKNNHVSNLEWVTHKENMRHSVLIGAYKDRYCENHGSSKLTNKEVITIFKLRGHGPARALSEKYNVSESCIRGIWLKTTWSRITGEIEQ